MKVDDIRSQLRRRGVSGTSALRKPELVKTLARTMRSEGRGGAARRSTGPAGRPAAKKTTAAKKTAAAKKTTAARRKATSPAKSAPAARATGARAKATGTRRAAPARAKATAARAKAAPARKASSARATASPSRAKAAPSRAKAAPSRAKAAPSRAKAAPSRAKAAPSRAKAAPSRAKAAPARKAASARAQAAPTLGPASSRSIGSSQLITSLADRPERPGRSLVTRNHEVIQRWARARGAKPATIAGTERGDRPGVLTFNIPGYRESSRIREVTWDDWFRTFDSRRLNLIYQEQMRDGRQSNFFRTENPNREDG
ncbi:hypothetical protein O7600_15865 [Micromonospora sp. WMMA1998]|uniref:hypothetical protein n=1 Tax=Micromonospora sp. WMMA1998 TaxID=3015167 RepID=UPI00248B4A6B|nr:hypothetical protein [Micromonospora sp. WMMA1998]WBC18090.1 hypothetical protein O7600_15865 [Micromonospora sp. WMMA1998]